MGSLSCLSIFEAGSFGSDSGNVIIASAAVPFPISSMAVGAGTITFAATADYDEESVGAGSITFAAAGAGESSIEAAGAGTITFDGAGSAFFGALVTLASDATAQDYSAGGEISWDTAAYDSSSVHSGTDFVIPAELNGRYGVFYATVAVSAIADNSSVGLAIWQNGSAAYVGSGQLRQYVGAGAEGGTEVWLQVTTHPIQLVTGDVYSVFFSSSDTSVTIESGRSSFGFIAYPSITGALVTKAADQTTFNSGAFPSLTWDSEVYDPDGAHDNVTDNNGLIIPSAWNGKYGIFRGTVALSSVTANSTLRSVMQKFVSSVDTPWVGRPWVSLHGGNFTVASQTPSTPPVLLATGHEYRIAINCSDTSVTVEADESAFSVQVLDTLTGCLCKKAADQTAANYSSPAVVAWDGTDVYDTDGLHDPSSSNTKIIIPSSLNGRYGVFHTTIYMEAASSGQQTSAYIRKNGSADYVGGSARSGQNTANTSVGIVVTTPPILLTTGDEYEVVLYSSDSSVTVQEEYSAFGMYVI